MNTLVDIQQSILTAFKTLHDAQHPTVDVNYPNLTVVDYENFTGNYFVGVELSWGDGIVGADLLMDQADITGRLYVSTHYKRDSGFTGAAAYVDMLLTGLCGKTLNHISYLGMKVYDISAHPGFVGKKCAIPFRVIG